MNCSIIIPVFNNSYLTKQCLLDLNKLPENYEIIIIDNASEDNTQEIVNKFSRVKNIINDKNEGFAKACNKGYKESSGKYIMFLNNDIRVKSDFESWPDRLIKKANNKIVGPTGGLLDKNFNFVTETNKLIDSPYFYMSGWCLTSSWQIWEELILNGDEGPFSTEFGIAFFEDTDLSFRAKQQNIGFDLIPVPVQHLGHQTAKKLNLNKLYTESKEIFKNKWKNRIISLPNY